MQSKKSPVLRITRGSFKSRKISSPNSKKTRPTLGRIREKIFNWLSPYIKQATCLDLFAGSGALGIEMISRGASYVTFVDHDIKAIGAIKKTAKLLSIKPEKYNCTQNFLEGVHKHKRKEGYDILFIDPPFFELSLSGVIYNLKRAGYIRKKTVVYIESSRWNNLYKIKCVKEWKLLKSGATKNVRYSIFYVN